MPEGRAIEPLASCGNQCLCRELKKRKESEQHLQDEVFKRCDRKVLNDKEVHGVEMMMFPAL